MYKIRLIDQCLIRGEVPFEEELNKASLIRDRGIEQKEWIESKNESRNMISYRRLKRNKKVIRSKKNRNEIIRRVKAVQEVSKQLQMIQTERLNN